MQKKKILIIGATGMLGHMVYRYFEKLNSYELYNSVFRNPLNENSIICNVRNQDEVQLLIERIKPNIVINCVGALVQESKINPTNAIYLNALFPHILKGFCNDYNTKLIHISTDCVFSGKRGEYSEQDFRDADDIYGRSKALGEIFDNSHCTLRTSIIGPELKNGTGLFNWFINRKGIVKGYTNAIWSGVSTLELAKAIDSAVINDLTGLFHVTNGIPISKYNLLLLIKKKLKLDDIDLIMDDTYRVNKSLIPSYKFDFKIPSYEEMVSEVVKNFQNEY